MVYVLLMNPFLDIVYDIKFDYYNVCVLKERLHNFTTYMTITVQ